MMGMDGGRRIFEREVVKPQNTFVTFSTVWRLFQTLLAGRDVEHDLHFAFGLGAGHSAKTDWSSG